MKLIHEKMGHILNFRENHVCELVVENRNFFFELVDSMVTQSDGGHGGCVLSVREKPVEFSRCADVTLQFAPFQLNRKSLLTKLNAALEQKALQADAYIQTMELLGNLEKHIYHLAEDLPFEIDCRKIAIGPIIRALSLEIAMDEKTALEKIFAYMELVRELDRDRLFIMVHMRSYFSDEDMERFVESVCLHDFKVLLLESNAYSRLKNTKRYIVDEDLCEF